MPVPMTTKSAFPARGSAKEVETGLDFTPKFDAAGLIPAVVTDAASGELLMLAHMNEDSLRLTLATGEAHFYSRSRRRLWRKGETSGNILRVAEVRTDCDQDALWLRVKVEGDGVCCHLGYRSCFFRTVEPADDAPAKLAMDPGPTRR